MMERAIETFNEQFRFEPKIDNPGSFKPGKKFIVSGMGGSHLAADLLLTWDSTIDIIIHQDYGLPSNVEGRLVIASSYSGNTEEVIDGYQQAIAKKLPTVAISIGGKLLEVAASRKLPYLRMPDTGIQPRSALGFSVKAFLRVMGLQHALKQVGELASLDPQSYEAEGKKLAKKLKGCIPVIYTSTRNRAIGYNWKIKFNETGKIPAFENVLPELNHNEMTGFDVAATTAKLSSQFSFLLLADNEDHPKIRQRMEMLTRLYHERGLKVTVLELTGKNRWYKIFTSLILADWVSLHTAWSYGVEAEGVPMVEEFKKLVS